MCIRTYEWSCCAGSWWGSKEKTFKSGGRCHQAHGVTSFYLWAPWRLSWRWSQICPEPITPWHIVSPSSCGGRFGGSKWDGRRPWLTSAPSVLEPSRHGTLCWKSLSWGYRKDAQLAALSCPRCKNRLVKSLGWRASTKLPFWQQDWQWMNYPKQPKWGRWWSSNYSIYLCGLSRALIWCRPTCGPWWPGTSMPWPKQRGSYRTQSTIWHWQS